MKKIIENLKWKFICWKKSIYFIATISLIMAVFAITFICKFFPMNSIGYNLGNSLCTGIVASFIVTIIIQIKQDNYKFNKKRAILFDAGFYLNRFQEQYLKKKSINKNIDQEWQQIFWLCKEPAEYLCDLYKRETDILDATDISIIRKINDNYKIIMILSEEISNNSGDENFLKNPNEIINVDNKYNDLISELKDNLFFILIKWKKDSIID